MKDIPSTWVLTEKQIEDFRQKEQYTLLAWSKQPRGSHGPEKH